jgi:hypothetical protein
MGMPPGHVRFADQRKIPVADLPPGEVWIPGDAEIDVAVSHADGDLYAELAGLSRPRVLKYDGGNSRAF